MSPTGTVDHYYIRVANPPYQFHAPGDPGATRGSPYYRHFLHSLNDSPEAVIARIYQANRQDPVNVAKVTRWVTETKAKFKKKMGTVDLSSQLGQWDNVRQLIDRYTEQGVRQNLDSQFDVHASYILPGSVVEPGNSAEQSRVVIALSSRNLLMNGVRQQLCGMDLSLNVDASY